MFLAHQDDMGGAYALSPALASGFEDFVAGFVYKLLFVLSSPNFKDDAYGPRYGLNGLRC